MIAKPTKLDPQEAWFPYEPDVGQPFDLSAAAHLYRRAGFGATYAQLEEAVARGAEETLRQLFEATPPAEFTTQVETLTDSILATGDIEQLSPWWLYRMRYSPAPLTEKMVLFWHGHFATSAAKVEDAGLMVKQHQLFRRHAMETFEPMVQEISRDPAMLIYLDSTTNRRNHPNENYARELMELFCLGPGNYTEADIQQLARCFTGWEVRRKQFRLDRWQHDRGEKLVLGESGPFTGEEAVKLVCNQPATARFITAKLVRYFVSDEPVAAEYIEPLAEQFAASGYHIGKLVETILSSRFFFSEHARGKKIRSPVELGIVLSTSLAADMNLKQLAEKLAGMGQRVFFPPNVKGWNGGQAWIHSASLIARLQFVSQLVHAQETQFGGAAGYEGLAAVVSATGAENPAETVQQLLNWLVAAQPPPSAVDRLVQLRQNDPSPRGLGQLLVAISALPEFQLA